MLYPSKVIVALDYDNQDDVLDLANQLDPKLCRLKIGKTLFTHYGPELVKKLQDKGFEIFLDLKFHDIPQQVAGACTAAAKLGIWMVNVHALGGLDMLQAARKAIDSTHLEVKPLLIGVTLLTSLSEKDIEHIGFHITPEEQVLRLAELCHRAKLDGIVCSAKEAAIVKSKFGSHFLCVTPGIRLADEPTHDQKRVVTPEEAIRLGSDYLVMGRSITLASSPNQKLQFIRKQVECI